MSNNYLKVNAVATMMVMDTAGKIAELERLASEVGKALEALHRFADAINKEYSDSTSTNVYSARDNARYALKEALYSECTAQSK